MRGHQLFRPLVCNVYLDVPETKPPVIRTLILSLIILHNFWMVMMLFNPAGHFAYFDVEFSVCFLPLSLLFLFRASAFFARIFVHITAQFSQPGKRFLRFYDCLTAALVLLDIVYPILVRVFLGQPLERGAGFARLGANHPLGRRPLRLLETPPR